MISSSKRFEQGELGRVVSVTMRKPRRLNPEQRHGWHFSKEQNGGLIQDLFIHDFDLLRWWTGQEIERVDSLMSKTILPEYPGFYDTNCAQVLMAGGVLAQLYADCIRRTVAGRGAIAACSCPARPAAPSCGSAATRRSKAVQPKSCCSASRTPAPSSA